MIMGDGDSIADFGSSDHVALDLKEIKKTLYETRILDLPTLDGLYSVLDRFLTSRTDNC